MATQYLDSAIRSKESVFCFSQSVLLDFHSGLLCCIWFRISRLVKMSTQGGGKGDSGQEWQVQESGRKQKGKKEQTQTTATPQATARSTATKAKPKQLLQMGKKRFSISTVRSALEDDDDDEDEKAGEESQSQRSRSTDDGKPSY